MKLYMGQAGLGL